MSQNLGRIVKVALTEKQNGFKYPFICTGNIGCIFEIPVPEDEVNALPVWQFYWSGEQMGPIPGHMQVVWLWEPEVQQGAVPPGLVP
jgi:hypothetical protein